MCPYSSWYLGNQFSEKLWCVRVRLPVDRHKTIPDCGIEYESFLFSVAKKLHDSQGI